MNAWCESMPKTFGFEVLFGLSFIGTRTFVRDVSPRQVITRPHTYHTNASYSTPATATTTAGTTAGYTPAPTEPAPTCQ